MRFLIVFLVCFSQLLVHSQDLEFTWLRSAAGAYEEVTEFMDIAVEQSGNILLTGSEETCYSPIVARLDNNGELIQYKVLEVPRLNYGRGVRIIPLEGGQSVVAAWGGVADDVAGSNAYVVFLDSLLEVITVDTIDTYTGFTPTADYRTLSAWIEGDTLVVSGMRLGFGEDSVRFVAYDLTTFDRIKEFGFAYGDAHFTRDETFSTLPYGGDSIIFGYNHKLQILKESHPVPVYDDSLIYRIHDLVATEDYYWLLTEGALSQLDQGLNELFRYSFSGKAERGFFIQTQDSLFAVIQIGEVSQVFTIDPAGTITDSFSQILPKLRFNAGAFHSQHGLLLAGQNVIRGSVKGISKGQPSDGDINILNLSYTNERFIDHPGTNVDQFMADVVITIQNGSPLTIDSFAVTSEGHFGFNCVELYFDQVFTDPINPGATTDVTMVAWFYANSGVPWSRQYCFTVYGPNGRIDEPKVANTFCDTLIYTGLENIIGDELIKVWPDWTNDRILIESPEMGAQVITLFNVAGQRVLEKSLIEGFSEINHRLPAGLYVWQIHNKKGELIGSDKLMLH